MSKVHYDQGAWYKRIWFDASDFSEITDWCPNFMKLPADLSDTVDLTKTNTVIGGAEYNRFNNTWYGDYSAWGPSLGNREVGSNFERVDPDNRRVCLYFNNWNRSHEDDDETKPVKFWLDISCDENGNIQPNGAYQNDYICLGYTQTGLVMANSWDGVSPASNLQFSANMSYHGDPSDMLNPDACMNFSLNHMIGSVGTQQRLIFTQGPGFTSAESFCLYSTLPIFADENAAKAYIEDGTIDPSTCFNSGDTYDNKDKHYYIQSRTYLYNNKNEQPYSKDSDPNKLDIKVKGRVHGYVQHNRGKYNIALVIEPNEDATMLNYSARHYGSPTYSATSIESFLDTQYAYDWNTYKDFEPYSVDRWVRGMDFKTNIYIYATKTAAEDAFDDPDIIPINYDDVEDSPENTTGDPVETADDLTDHSHSTLTGMLTLYRVGATGMSQLGDSLADYPNWTDKDTALAIYGESPINALVSIYHSCIDISDFIDTVTPSSPTGIKFGSHIVQILDNGFAQVTSYGKLVTVGSCLFNPIYGDYRDYTNFTYELHLPFSNPITFDTREVMGKSMVIKATIDPYAMQMRYYIILNGAVYRAVDVAFGTQIGVVGNDAAGKAREMRQDILSVKEQKTNVAKSFMNTVGGVVGSAARGDFIGAASSLIGGGIDINMGAAKTQNAQMNQLQDAQLDPTRTFVGTFSPGCAESDILYPYLVTYETRAIVPAALESTYGRPANIIGKLGSVSGYTCAELARVAVNCTEAEKAEIEQLVNGGIII